VPAEADLVGQVDQISIDNTMVLTLIRQFESLRSEVMI
jgi:hypothetical protein